MTLGFEPASNDSSFTLKTVFSFGLAAAAASSPAAAASSAPAPAAEGATAPAAGNAISWMFKRVCKFFIYILRTCGLPDAFLTLRRVTRSAAWRSVRTDMSSTILCRAGSEGNAPELELGPAAAAAVESLLDGRGGGGGGGDEGDVDDDEDAWVVAVASARARTNDSVLLLCAETLCGWMDGWRIRCPCQCIW